MLTNHSLHIREYLYHRTGTHKSLPSPFLPRNFQKPPFQDHCLCHHSLHNRQHRHLISVGYLCLRPGPFVLESQRQGQMSGPERNLTRELGERDCTRHHLVDFATSFYPKLEHEALP